MGRHPSGFSHCALNCHSHYNIHCLYSPSVSRMALLTPLKKTETSFQAISYGPACPQQFPSGLQNKTEVEDQFTDMIFVMKPLQCTVGHLSIIFKLICNFHIWMILTIIDIVVVANQESYS